MHDWNYAQQYNTIQQNYQYDISGISKFINEGKQLDYTNNFISIDDDMIAAVGTYFNQEGVNYTVQIKVNGKIVYTQKGTSEYYGYHTIKLDKYVSIKKDDSFSITITSNAVLYQNHQEHTIKKEHHSLEKKI